MKVLHVDRHAVPVDQQGGVAERLQVSSDGRAGLDLVSTQQLEDREATVIRSDREPAPSGIGHFDHPSHGISSAKNAHATPGTPSCYRIQDPESRLYVRFTCTPAPLENAPRIVARLTRRERATRFVRHSAAAECFARFLAGQPLEIVRCDQ